MVVRDHQPDRFLDAHVALFALATTRAGTSGTRARCARPSPRSTGVDADAVFAAIATGEPLAVDPQRARGRRGEARRVGRAHVHRRATRPCFVRLMDRPAGDGAHATRTIERVLDLLTWPELNEFKHTSIPR